MAIDIDTNCLSYWFPRIEAAGLPVPETRIVRTDTDLVDLLDGEKPDGYDHFIGELQEATDAIGYPCFLRTGQTSGKHDWEDTCYLTDTSCLRCHVSELVDYSHAVDLFGLPVDVWVARRLIPTAPIFMAFWGMPITREFRLFVKDGIVRHIQPYWPPDAITSPSVMDWRERLDSISHLNRAETEELVRLAWKANEAVPGYWSVDFLQDSQGAWWLTDMALGQVSFRWDAPEDFIRVETAS